MLEYAAALLAVIEGVEIVPLVAIVVVPVAPNEVTPKKLLEFANCEAPRAKMEPEKLWLPVKVLLV